METEIPVKTTETMFQIVEVLLDRNGARFTSLVDELGMPRSTLHDHLQTMDALGLLVKRDNEYHVSTLFLDFGGEIRHQRPVYQAAHEQVKNLAVETGEHASLMVEENGQGVLLDVKKGDKAVDIDAYFGRRLPLPPHAPGKIILAHLPDDRIERILDEYGLPQYTSKTITDRETLWDELERVKDQGYAVDDEELISGIRALSVPIRTQKTLWGALTVGGPTNRMQDEYFETNLLEVLMEAANLVELNLNVRR